MKATLFKEVGYSLSKLIEDVDMGEIGLPDIQRPFVWTPAKVRDLFDSMYRGFPVGYLLFWSNGIAAGARQIGTEGKQNAPRLLIVDGQQRLTSLYAVLKARMVVRDDYSEERIFVAFRPRDAKFDVTDAAIRKDPEYIPDISQLWAGETTRNKFVKEFLAKLRTSRTVTDEEEDELSESIDRLYDLQSYPFTALELSSTVDEEQVADVFVRINSKGVHLNQADFILTLMSVFWDEGRAALEKFSREARRPSDKGASPYNHFIQPQPDQLLRVAIAVAFRRARLEHVYSILRGKDLETQQFSEERRTAQFGKLGEAQAEVLNLSHWHEFLKCLVRAGFRSSAMITSETGILYAYAFFLIGRRDFKVDAFTLRNIIAKWFFFTSLTGRYSGSPESTMEEDLARIRNLETSDEFVAALEATAGAALTVDYWTITLPDDLATSSARTPTLYAYYAALNLLKARVPFSQLEMSGLMDPTLKAPRASLERHHIFPRGYLKSIGLTELRDQNQIANYALVEWVDNALISDEPPSEYWPKFLESRAIDEQDLAETMYWHALPAGWEELEYDEFLSRRRKLLAKVIAEGYLKLATGKVE